MVARQEPERRYRTTKGVLLSRYKATNIMKNLGLVSCQVKKNRYKKAENEHLNIPNTLDH